MARATPPIALTIAGSDPSGGAGIQADLKTFAVLGVYGASVITALTAQNTVGVTGVHKVPADFIKAQFDAVTSDLAIAAVKTGMLSDAETVRAVASLLAGLGPPHLVVDPVMVATSGDRLLDENAISAVRDKLIPLADLITPNLQEAAALLGVAVATTESAMEDQAQKMLGLGCGAVLIKGGHGAGATAVDILVTVHKVLRYERPRIETSNTHGTGCTLAAAITAQLAKGATLAAAVERSKDFVWSALQSGADHKIGAGNGPVDHLFHVRKIAL
jgi:hydroxymethylpyrimidine/phosphomethylpyrimidine kinase